MCPKSLDYKFEVHDSLLLEYLKCLNIQYYKDKGTKDIEKLIIRQKIEIGDGYYVTYKPTTLPCISFMFI